MKAGQEFIERTKYHHLPPADQTSGIPQPPLELDYNQNANLIELPLPQDMQVYTADLTTAIQHRQSIRKHSPMSMSLGELSHLLWCTQGVKEIRGNRTMRTVPSAGGCHALETWLVINNVADIQPGLYRFIATKHQLELVTPSIDGDLAAAATQLCYNQPFVKTAAALFIWVAVPYRMAWRYSDRAFRYLYLDAGHVCQNLYLAAESISAGVCAIARYDDDGMNAFLGLDGEQAFAIYLATVGLK